MWSDQLEEWDREIESLRADIVRLEEHRYQCEKAFHKVGKEQTEYIEACHIYKRKALELRESFQNVCFAKCYGPYIEQRLSGMEHEKVANEFDELRETIRVQEYQAENEIQDAYRRIAELEQRIAETERQSEQESVQWG